MFNFYMRAGLPGQLRRVQNTQQKPDTGIMTMYALKNDCFVKTPYVGLDIPKDYKIEKLFDETYNEVLRDAVYANPVIAGLNLPRPALKTSAWMEASEPASYNYADNEMTFSENYDEDMYLLISKDEEGRTADISEINADELDSVINSALNSNGRQEVLKLTPEEKDFRLKAAIAHELRHYIQHHIIASSEGISDELHDRYFDIFLNAQEIQDNYIESCKKNGIKPDKNLISARMPDYWDRYTPKTMLDRNTLLKFSSNKKDKRCFSLDDIMKGIDESIKYGRYGGGNYFARPSEIDAHNYESEYIKKFASVNNVRKAIADYLAEKAAEKCAEGVNRMEKAGSCFIEQ